MTARTAATRLFKWNLEILTSIRLRCVLGAALFRLRGIQHQRGVLLERGAPILRHVAALLPSFPSLSRAINTRQSMRVHFGPETIDAIALRPLMEAILYRPMSELDPCRQLAA
jgi:hypothetical protein